MISGILIAAAVTIMMAMLYSASKGKAKESEQGQLLLRLRKFYWILGAFMIIVGIALGIWLCIIWQRIYFKYCNN